MTLNDEIPWVEDITPLSADLPVEQNLSISLNNLGFVDVRTQTQTCSAYIPLYTILKLSTKFVTSRP